MSADRIKELKDRLADYASNDGISLNFFYELSDMLDLISTELEKRELLLNKMFVEHTDEVFSLLKKIEKRDRAIELLRQQRNSRMSSSDGMMMQRSAYDRQIEELLK